MIRSYLPALFLVAAFSFGCALDAEPSAEGESHATSELRKRPALESGDLAEESTGAAPQFLRSGTTAPPGGDPRVGEPDEGPRPHPWSPAPETTDPSGVDPSGLTGSSKGAPGAQTSSK